MQVQFTYNQAARQVASTNLTYIRDNAFLAYRHAIRQFARWNAEARAWILPLSAAEQAAQALIAAGFTVAHVGRPAPAAAPAPVQTQVIAIAPAPAPVSTWEKLQAFRKVCVALLDMGPGNERNEALLLRARLADELGEPLELW